jgi:hypothetical protein
MEGGCIRASDDLIALNIKLLQQYHLSENSTAVLAGSGSGCDRIIAATEFVRFPGESQRRHNAVSRGP